MKIVATVLSLLASIALAIGTFACWVHHVVYTINHQEWILLAVGAFIPPVGIIHGLGLWLGWFVQ